MALPKSVEAQNARADELIKGINEPVKPAETPAPVETPAPIETPVPEPVVTPPAPSVDELTTKLAESEQRYNTLKGKYDSEVPKLHAENAYLKSTVNGIERRMAELEKAQAQPAVAPSAPASIPEGVEYIKKEMPQLVEAIEYMLGTKLDALVKPILEGKIKELGTKIENVEVKTKEDAATRFYTDLTGLVPTWEAMNNDPKFLEWLAVPERYTGLRRYDLLQTAVASLNAGKAAQFFTDYLTEIAPKTPATPAGAEPVVKPKPSEAPPKAGDGTPPPAPPASPEITQAFIARFYKEKAQGRYKGREDEAKKVEALINSAVSKGLVVK